MKKLLAAAGLMALAACGGPEPEAVDTDADTEEKLAEIGRQVDPSGLAGTYRGTGEDGVEWATTLNPDGTYQDTMGGEVSETGTWEGVDGKVCFTRDVAEGELGEPDSCFGLGAVGQDGSVVLTTPDGEIMQLQKDVG